MGSYCSMCESFVEDEELSLAEELEEEGEREAAPKPKAYLTRKQRRRTSNFQRQYFRSNRFP